MSVSVIVTFLVCLFVLIYVKIKLDMALVKAIGHESYRPHFPSLFWRQLGWSWLFHVLTLPGRRWRKVLHKAEILTRNLDNVSLGRRFHILAELASAELPQVGRHQDRVLGIFIHRHGAISMGVRKLAGDLSMMMVWWFNIVKGIFLYRKLEISFRKGQFSFDLFWAFAETSDWKHQDTPTGTDINHQQRRDLLRFKMESFQQMEILRCRALYAALSLYCSAIVHKDQTGPAKMEPENSRFLKCLIDEIKEPNTKEYTFMSSCIDKPQSPADWSSNKIYPLVSIIIHWLTEEPHLSASKRTFILKELEKHFGVFMAPSNRDNLERTAQAAPNGN